MEVCVVFGGVYAKDRAVWRVKEEVESCAADSCNIATGARVDDDDVKIFHSVSF